MIRHCEERSSPYIDGLLHFVRNDDSRLLKLNRKL